MNTSPNTGQKVVIFDGVCNFCNSTINFILKHDREGKFKFAPNQSAEGQLLLQQGGYETSDVSTVFYYNNGHYYHRSAAILRILIELGLPWNLMGVFLIVPAFIRDAVYSLVARNRYRWFGKRESCRIPTPEERARFL